MWAMSTDKENRWLARVIRTDNTRGLIRSKTFDLKQIL
jgi:hypothetical protein